MKRLHVPGIVFVALAASFAMNNSRGSDPTAKDEGQRVKKLFETMRDGKYAGIEFPHLDWGDVPALLDYADSTKTLKTFPRSDLSSQYEPECSEGMVALWLIEGIRTGGRNPSLNVLCFKAGGGGTNWGKASEGNHKEVAKAYRAWWEKAKSLPHEKARTLDPLKDTNLAWH